MHVAQSPRNIAPSHPVGDEAMPGSKLFKKSARSSTLFFSDAELGLANAQDRVAGSHGAIPASPSQLRSDQAAAAFDRLSEQSHVSSKLNAAKSAAAQEARPSMAVAANIAGQTTGVTSSAVFAELFADDDLPKVGSQASSTSVQAADAGQSAPQAPPIKPVVQSSRPPLPTPSVSPLSASYRANSKQQSATVTTATAAADIYGGSYNPYAFSHPVAQPQYYAMAASYPASAASYYAMQAYPAQSYGYDYADYSFPSSDASVTHRSIQPLPPGT